LALLVYAHRMRVSNCQYQTADCQNLPKRRFWICYAYLAILDGKLDPTVMLPTDREVRVPAAGQAQDAVAGAGADGALLQAPYSTSVAGEDIIIKFTSMG
jgi:hypothetical protein